MRDPAMHRKPVRPVYISIDMKATGQNIKRLLKDNGYSVRDVMEITSISTEQAIYKWFRGESLPSIDAQLALCKQLGIRMEELFVINEEPLWPGLPYFDQNAA